MKYTREDVIIWADDERLEIGKEYFYADNAKGVLDSANEDDVTGSLLEVDKNGEVFPFVVEGEHGYGNRWSFLILKKEPEKKLVPFDFSLKEDRDALMGKRIRTDACDMVVTTFAYWLAHGWQIQIDSENGFSGEYVLENFVFADGPNEGEPVGKEIEE